MTPRISVSLSKWKLITAVTILIMITVKRYILVLTGGECCYTREKKLTTL